jgi:hypothetical protein
VVGSTVVGAAGGSTGAATIGCVGSTTASTGVPQLAQKRSVADVSAPQFVQVMTFPSLAKLGTG